MTDSSDHDPGALAAAERVADFLADHILFGYGRCSCGTEFSRYGRYSEDHRHHLGRSLADAGLLRVAPPGGPP